MTKRKAKKEILDALIAVPGRKGPKFRTFASMGLEIREATKEEVAEYYRQHPKRKPRKPKA